MTAITFDTFQMHKKLKSRGFTEEQAEALTEMAQETMRVAMDVHEDNMEAIATKGDIAAIEVKIEAMRNDILKWYIGVGMFQTIAFLGGIITVAKLLHP